MNTQFNINRFWAVLKKSLMERPMQLFGLTLVMLGLVLLIYSTCRDLMGYPVTQVMSFFIGLVGGGYFLAASVFGNFNTYARGASYLTLPASNLEKWLAGLVIVLLYAPLFLLFFRGMDSILVEIYKNNLDPKLLNYPRLLEEAKILNYDSANVRVMFKLYLNISALMLLGSLYFNKMGIIKMVLIICIGIFILIGLNFMIAKVFFSESISTIPFFFLTVKTEEMNRSLELPAYANTLINIAFLYLLPSILFLISFLRFNEKEF